MMQDRAFQMRYYASGWSSEQIQEEIEVYDPETYMVGQCAAWALGHQRLHPELRFGMHYEKLSQREIEKEEHEMGLDPGTGPQYEVQHVFTHDDKYAYDAEGAHPMPFEGWDESEFNLTKDDVYDTGMVEGGYIPITPVMKHFDPFGE